MDSNSDALYIAVFNHVQCLMNRGGYDAAKTVAAMSPLPPLIKSVLLQRIETESKLRRSAESVPHRQSD